MKEGWEIKKLGEVCDFQGGSQPPKDEWVSEPKDGYVRMLQIRDFTQNRCFEIEYVKVTNRLKYCETDDILLGRYGASVGKVLTGLSGAYNVAIMKTIPDMSLIRKDFFKYFLKSSFFQSFILQVSTMRAAQAGFSKEDIQDYSLSIPPLEEQERIVEELDCLSGVIEKKKQQLKELDALAQSIFYEMFGNPVENDRGWEVKKLGEVCTLKAGKAIKSTELCQEFALGLYPCFGGNGIRGYIAKVSHNDFFPIIGRQGALCGNVVLSTKEFYATEHAVVVQPITDMNIIWLYYTLKFMNLNRLAQGVAQPGLSVSNIIKENIFLPTLILQQQFAEKIEKIEKQKELIRKSIEEVEMLFNSRMDYYFG